MILRLKKILKFIVDNKRAGAIIFFGLLLTMSSCNRIKDFMDEKKYLYAIEKGDVEAMRKLGNLYSNQGKFSEAEKYWLQAAENRDAKAMYITACNASAQ